MKRDWTDAIAKIASEGACRACGATEDLDVAHLVPRSRLRADEGAEDPRNVIPLCRRCHNAQHDGRLELLGLLSKDEQGFIAGLVGIEEARRRTTITPIGRPS